MRRNGTPPPRSSSRRETGAWEHSGLPTPAAPELEDRSPRRALVACRDRTSRRWAIPWLERAGFEVEMAAGAPEIRMGVESETPSIVILEAGLREGKAPLYTSLAKRSEAGAFPLLVLCAKDRQVRDALEAGVSEVARRPYDWQLISRRATLLVDTLRAGRELMCTRDALERALDQADTTQQQLDQRGTLDPLTELPNRRIFRQLLARALATPRPEEALIVVLLLDLDRFGSINESLGRDGGNALLALVAQRLKECLHREELLAARTSGLVSAALSRQIGDQFAMMISNVSSTEHLRPMSEQILRAVAEPFKVDGSSVYLSASVGVACYPPDAAGADELIQHAEMALLEAKQMGGGLLHFYNPSLNEKACHQVEVDRELRRAVERGELALHYQPLVSFADRQVVGAEALLRWHHPERGLLPALEFILVAEETGLMVQIGAWALREACRQLAVWTDAGLETLRMAINVSHCQLTRGNLVEDVRAALEETGIAPERLELELSERGVLGRVPGVAEVLADLKALGVTLSIDDFGTGESAIAYLKHLPIDVLKIDRSYVEGAALRSDDATIASAMVAMAHQLRLKVVAEGIESDEQIRYVGSWGCDEFQGYLFARPLAPEAFQALVEAAGEATDLPAGKLACRPQ